MHQACIFKRKKKINYNRANLKRIRIFEMALENRVKNNTICKHLTRIVVPVPKFLDPIGFYRLPGDLIIEDKLSLGDFGNKINGPINHYRNFKKVVAIHFDISSESLSVSLMNFNDDYGSVGLLVSRLRTLGIASAKNLSDCIELLGKKTPFPANFKEVSPTPEEKDKHRAFITNKNKTLSKLNQEQSIFLVSHFNTTAQGIVQLHKFSFSKALFNILFDTVEEGMHFISNEGLPEFLWSYKDHYEHFVLVLRRIFLQKEDDPIYTKLITKNYEVIMCKLNFIREFYIEENFLEGYLIHIMTPLYGLTNNIKECQNLKYLANDKSSQRYFEEHTMKCEPSPFENEINHHPSEEEKKIPLEEETKNPSEEEKIIQLEEKDETNDKRCHYRMIETHKFQMTDISYYKNLS